MKHDTLLFNIHDLVLLMAAGQYFLLSALLLFTRRKSDNSILFLIAILLLNTVQAVDTIFTWSDKIRDIILNSAPNLLFVGSMGHWLEGPLLLCYVRSVLYKGYQLKVADAIHLIPLFIYIIYLLFEYYFLPAKEKMGLMTELDFIRTPMMGAMVYAWNVSFISYGWVSFFVMLNYRRQLREQYANIEVSSRDWLNWIIGGFILIATWKLFVHAFSEFFPLYISNILGIMGNYLTFFFVFSLVFLSERYSRLFTGIQETESSPPIETQFKEEHIERISRIMNEEKLYLDQEVSLDRLSKKLSIPEKTVSRILNQYYKKNFFEFINTYRVEEAKRILSDPEKAKMPMLEVLAESGFTSKSTFNTIFKRITGATPSQYRNTQLEKK